MKFTKIKKWLALSLMLGTFGYLKAQDESIGNSGTCCPQKGATCYTLTWDGELWAIQDKYFQNGSGPCPDE